MLRKHFGFNEDPFGFTPDPRYLYYSPTYKEALASLKYGFLSNRGFTALIAPPGMGKTTLLFRFLEDIRESARSVFLFDIDYQCEPRDLVRYILRDIGITPGQNGAEMHDQLNGVLVTEARARRRFVIVIDEAQNLSDAALEMVRLLSNFETPRDKLMQIILAGQPQLSHKLMQPSLLQLRQRISTVCQLEPLSPVEIGAYIVHRLKLAGYRGNPLFSEDALNLIKDASQGIPRTINNLCFNTLSLCYALKSKQVDVSMVAESIADLQLVPQSCMTISPLREPFAGQPREPEQAKQPSGQVQHWILAAMVLLVVSVLAAVGFYELQSSRFYKTGDARFSEAKVPPTPATPNPSEIVVVDHPMRPLFEVVVKPNQTLGDIAIQYLGDFDLQRLHQIQALNPNLVDPNLIKPGQRLQLPGPVAKKTTPLASVRDIQ